MGRLLEGALHLAVCLNITLRGSLNNITSTLEMYLDIGLGPVKINYIYVLTEMHGSYCKVHFITQFFQYLKYRHPGTEFDIGLGNVKVNNMRIYMYMERVLP